MTLYFHPDRGTILICDFHGLIVPEMVKVRPVVIVSPRPRKKNIGLCTVVPLSTTPPNEVMSYHHKILLDVPLSPKWPAIELWAKCDMLYTLSTQRLDRFYTKAGGQRKYYDVKLAEGDVADIMNSIRSYLGV